MFDSGCDMRLELDADGQPPVVGASESLTGTIYVEVDDEVDCDDLVVRAEWATRGRGVENSGSATTEQAFQGTLKPGRTYEYPFDLALTPGPYTRSGEYLHLNWTLVAEADIPWASDPRAEQEFILEPDGDSQYLAGQLTGSELQNRPPTDDSGVDWRKTIAGAVAILLPLIGAWALWTYMSTKAALSALAFGLVLIAIGGVTFYRGIRNAVAETRLGDIDVELSPAPISPGEPLECRVTVDPNGEVQVTGVHCTLENYEQMQVAEQGRHGKSERTRTHTVYERQWTPREVQSISLDGPQKAEVELRMPLPDDAAHSLALDDNQVIWEVTVHVDIPNWPDWKYTEPFVVRPEPELEYTDSDDQPDNAGASDRSW